MSAQTPIKCPICAKSNKVSGAAQTSGISRAKIWRNSTREDLGDEPRGGSHHRSRSSLEPARRTPLLHLVEADKWCRGPLILKNDNANGYRRMVGLPLNSVSRHPLK